MIKINGNPINVTIFPDNTFKFADGLSLKDNVSVDQLREVFRDGKLLIEESFSDIRKRLNSNG